MDLGLANKVALVTGSSRGLGRASAIGLAAEGCRVCITARGADVLREAEREIAAAGGQVLAVAADVTKAEEVRRLVEAVEKAFGGVDILVNNVGGSRGAGLMETTDEQFQEALDANLFAAIRVSREVIPLMLRRGGGSIVNIASIYGREAGGTIAYNAAKAAEISLTKQMARELASRRIRVNAVAPGSIMFPGGSWDRRMKADPEAIAEFERREMPFGFGKPENVADVVVFLASERAAHVSGACWVVDGVQSRSNI
ncbi:MAG TPA: SDR family NAD(P)-dependent oxidoreductase [Chloroflexota bacterium]